MKTYNNYIYAQTKKYQKQYGFEIGAGKHDAWNNESDAFKHTYMSADLALRYTVGLSKCACDKQKKTAIKIWDNRKVKKIWTDGTINRDAKLHRK